MLSLFFASFGQLVARVVGKGGLNGRVGVHVERCLPLRSEGKDFFERNRIRRDGEHLDR